MSESGREQSETTFTVPAPFKALIAGWSLIVVVLSVAGYSFRWNYYYNFGLQSLVLSAPLQSLPVYAIEIARNRAFLLDVLWLALLYLLPFHLALLALKRACTARNARVRETARTFMRVVAVDNRLLIEAVGAALVILIAFRAGGDAGNRSYLEAVSEKTSKLPMVTAIAHPGATASALSIACDTRTFKDADASKALPFLGEPSVVRSLAAGGACSMKGYHSWRLLLRDDKFVYLFATVQNTEPRPQTLVLPNSGELTLVLQ